MSKIGTPAHLSQLKIWRRHDDETDSEDAKDESVIYETQIIPVIKPRDDALKLQKNVTEQIIITYQSIKASQADVSKLRSARNRRPPSRFQDFEL